MQLKWKKKDHRGFVCYHSLFRALILNNLYSEPGSLLCDCQLLFVRELCVDVSCDLCVSEL